MVILKTENLKKNFGGVRALNGISIAAEAGEITSIIGPNGSGKSTLVNIVTGVYGKSAGHIVVHGKARDINSAKIFSYGITRTFQEVRLLEQMSVIDNLLVVLTKKNIFGSLFEFSDLRYSKKARNLLEIVGLWEKRNAFASQLSYGQRKLLEIARVLAADADIVLLDEPFAGLFPETVKHITDIIKTMKYANKAVVLIEHNMELVRELSDTVFVLDSGELLASGAPEATLKEPKVIEAYLGE